MVAFLKTFLVSAAVSAGFAAAAPVSSSSGGQAARGLLGDTRRLFENGGTPPAEVGAAAGRESFPATSSRPYRKMRKACKKIGKKSQRELVALFENDDVGQHSVKKTIQHCKKVAFPGKQLSEWIDCQDGRCGFECEVDLEASADGDGLRFHCIVAVESPEIELPGLVPNGNSVNLISAAGVSGTIDFKLDPCGMATCRRGGLLAAQNGHFPSGSFDFSGEIELDDYTSPALTTNAALTCGELDIPISPQMIAAAAADAAAAVAPIPAANPLMDPLNPSGQPVAEGIAAVTAELEALEGLAAVVGGSDAVFRLELGEIKGSQVEIKLKVVVVINGVELGSVAIPEVPAITVRIPEELLSCPEPELTLPPTLEALGKVTNIVGDLLGDEAGGLAGGLVGGLMNRFGDNPGSEK